MRRVIPLLAILLAGCSTAAEGSWVLTEMVVDGNAQAIPAEITLDVDGGRVSGSSGCNTYSGDTFTDDGELLVENVAVTEVFCTDTDVMAAEARYLDELVTNPWTVATDDSTLTLTDARDDGTRLTFEAP